MTLPRVAVDQFAAGVAVKLDELRRGELIFNANTDTTGNSHIGIYVGGGC